MSQELHFAVSQFLYRKAELCDAYEWDDYLELYMMKTANIIFHSG